MEGDGEQAAEGPGVRRRKAFDADQSSTLRDAKALASKAVDETFDTDPMFAKTSRLFDENSASGGFTGRSACYELSWLLMTFRPPKSETDSVAHTLPRTSSTNGTCDCH